LCNGKKVLSTANIIRQSQPYNIIMFWRSGSSWIWYTWGQLDMCTQGSPAGIQTPTHWNLTGDSRTASPHVMTQLRHPHLIVLSFPPGQI
jgi:hypothetical protein